MSSLSVLLATTAVATQTLPLPGTAGPRCPLGVVVREGPSAASASRERLRLNFRHLLPAPVPRGVPGVVVALKAACRAGGGGRSSAQLGEDRSRFGWAAGWLAEAAAAAAAAA